VIPSLTRFPMRFKRDGCQLVVSPGMKSLTSDRFGVSGKQIFPVPGGGCDWIIDRHPQRILKPRSDRDKYSIAYLYKNGKSFIHKVHRLVLLTFVGPCPPGMQACHNNGNPFDNYPSNLRWDTISANQFDSIKHGTAKSLKQNGMA